MIDFDVLLALVSAVFGTWLSLDFGMPRVARIACTLLALGAWLDALDALNRWFLWFSFTSTTLWPGLLLRHAGAGLLMGYWVYRRRVRRS